MKKMLTIGLLFMTFCALAQSPREQQPFVATMPSTTFHSTGSATMSSGSAYAANPVLNTDGTATLYGESESYTPSQRPGGGPRKAGAFDDPSDDMPIGDPVIPLILTVMVYTAYIFLRRRKSRI